MKGEENMKEWRRLEERQDHNEGQDKGKIKRESKRCVKNTQQLQPTWET